MREIGFMTKTIINSLNIHLKNTFTQQHIQQEVTYLKALGLHALFLSKKNLACLSQTKFSLHRTIFLKKKLESSLLLDQNSSRLNSKNRQSFFPKTILDLLDYAQCNTKS